MAREECARRLRDAFGSDECATAEETYQLMQALAVCMDGGERLASAGKVMLSFLKFADQVEIRAVDIHITSAYMCHTLDGETSWEGRPLRKYQSARYIPWLKMLNGFPVERGQAMAGYFDWLAEFKGGDDCDEGLQICRWFWPRWVAQAS